MIIQVLHCLYRQGTDIVRHGKSPKASNATGAANAERDGDARFCWTVAMLGNHLG